MGLYGIRGILALSHAGFKPMILGLNDKIQFRINLLILIWKILREGRSGRDLSAKVETNHPSLNPDAISGREEQW